MTNRLSISVLVAATIPLLSALGCASTSNSSQTPEANGETARTMQIGGKTIDLSDASGGQQVHVKGPPLTALSALAQVYGDMKIPIGTMVTSTGQIGNQNLAVPTHRINGKALSTYLNCGQESMSGSRADLGDVTISIVSKAVADGDSASVVTTDLQGWARPSASSSNIVPCQSNGILEHDINVKLAAAMGSSS